MVTLPSKLLRKSALLALLAAASLALIIVACGTDDEDEPAATAAPAATMAPTAAPATAAPAPTAAPTPAPTTEAAPELVSPRLIVSMAPPAHQVRLPYMTFQSASGPLHNLYDYLVGKDRKTAEVENTHIAESWSVDAGATTWIFELKEGIPYYMNGKASDTYFFEPTDVRHTWLLQAGVRSDKSNNSSTYGPWLASEDGSDLVIEGNTLTWEPGPGAPGLERIRIRGLDLRPHQRGLLERRGRRGWLRRPSHRHRRLQLHGVRGQRAFPAGEERRPLPEGALLRRAAVPVEQGGG